jgi:hypothetical protein
MSLRRHFSFNEELNDRLTFFGSGKLPGRLDFIDLQENQGRSRFSSCIPARFPGHFPLFYENSILKSKYIFIAS